MSRAASSGSDRSSSVQDKIELRQIDGLIVANPGELTPLETQENWKSGTTALRAGGHLLLARTQAHGAELIGRMEYEYSYRLAYVRGPEGITVGLAEQLA